MLTFLLETYAKQSIFFQWVLSLFFGEEEGFSPLICQEKRLLCINFRLKTSNVVHYYHCFFYSNLFSHSLTLGSFWPVPFWSGVTTCGSAKHQEIDKSFQGLTMVFDTGMMQHNASYFVLPAVASASILFSMPALCVFVARCILDNQALGQ